jgi:hypothetical protein
MTFACSVTRRRARAEDEEFAFSVLKETMQEYAVATTRGERTSSN